MKVISIRGVSTRAGNRGAGNEFIATGSLSIRMVGGTARLHVEVKEKEDVKGTATFRLEKNEAIQLINGLKEIYNLEAL